MARGRGQARSSASRAEPAAAHLLITRPHKSIFQWARRPFTFGCHCSSRGRARVGPAFFSSMASTGSLEWRKTHHTVESQDPRVQASSGKCGSRSRVKVGVVKVDPGRKHARPRDAATRCSHEMQPRDAATRFLTASDMAGLDLRSGQRPGSIDLRSGQRPGSIDLRSRQRPGSIDLRRLFDLRRPNGRPLT